MDTTQRLPHVALALALSLGAAVSLGITRFAYGLLLPPMRADLQWSYTLAGAMNTANALGYLLGALATPRLMQRLGPSRLALGGAVLASVFMGLSGFFTGAASLLLQRVLAGIASAFLFIAGGLLAARLGAHAAAPRGPAARPVLRRHRARHRAVGAAGAGGARGGAGAPARVVVGLVGAGAGLRGGHRGAGLAGAGARARACVATGGHAGAPRRRAFRWRDFAPGLAGYAMFGVGYIGYMTFVIALLREQGVAPHASRCSMRCSGWRCWRRRASGPACSIATAAGSRWRC